MVRPRKRRRVDDLSAGGKRSAMAPHEDPGDGIAVGDGATAAREGGLRSGLDVIGRAVRSLPNCPGVYRMLDRRGDALYVGKASNLKKRVAAYTVFGKLPRRLQRMVAETTAIEIVTTHTEVEALLLESNLIKRLMPRYNVLLRDDKSFPYILLTGDHPYPQIAKYRGAHTRDGDYFGPFASAGAVNRTVTALEKAFLLRSCSDSVFASRRRPCLMYQIKRCSAPCVGRISKPAYDDLVQQSKDFLTGSSRDIRQSLAESMQQAADRLDFETAAVYRDRVRALAHIQAHQDINVEGLDSADVIAAHQEAGHTCIEVFFFRAGRNYGNRAYFPAHDKNLGVAAVLSAFVAQFYDNKPTPRQVIVSHRLEDQALLSEALALRAGTKIDLLVPERGAKRKLIEHAIANAREALARRLAESTTQRGLLEGLSDRLGLDAAPERIEVYDNSHIHGDKPYGAMIVAGPDGFVKSAYRKFAIRGTGHGEDGSPQAGDDYAMMREVFTRRFSRAIGEDPERSSAQWPDLVLLDGGQGQLSAAQESLADLGLGDLSIAAVAKGPERNAGRERIFLPGRQPFLLDPRDPILYFIQRLRDEAHRFAVASHRTGRGKALGRSELDHIAGVGRSRKRALLHHFGSARAVAGAGLADLEAVEGINKGVARKIYDYFHDTA